MRTIVLVAKNQNQIIFVLDPIPPLLQSRSIWVDPKPTSHPQIIVQFDIQSGLLTKQESAGHLDRNDDLLAVHIPT